MKKTGAVMAVLALLLAACSSGASQGSVGETTANGQATAIAEATDPGSDDPVRIGAVLSSSGYASWLGETERRAVEVLADRVNREGGIDGQQLEIVFKDDQSDPEEAVRVTRELVEENVVAILGPSLTPTSLAAAPIAQEAGVPLISMSGGFQPANAEESPWGWSVVAGAGPAIVKVLDYAVATGRNRIGTITPTDPLGEAGDAGLVQLLEGNGPFAEKMERIGHEKFNLDDTDVRPQLQNLAAGNPDIIFAGVSGEAIANVRRQMDELGMEDIELATYHSNTTPQVLDLLDGVTGALVLPGTAVNVAGELPDGDLAQEVDQFLNEYAAVSDQVPMSTEGFGYDALKIVVTALEEGATDAESIREWLDEGQEIVGINYVMNFSADNHVAAGPESLIMMRAVPGEAWERIDSGT